MGDRRGTETSLNELFYVGAQFWESTFDRENFVTVIGVQFEDAQAYREFDLGKLKIRAIDRNDNERVYNLVDWYLENNSNMKILKKKD